MDIYRQEIVLIKKILEENPKGMTVKDISKKIKINRNSVAKYLDIMRISGHVDMITFGPAKVFFPTARVPILDLLNYTSDCIMILDERLKIKIINDPFLNLIGKKREEIQDQIINKDLLNFLYDQEELLFSMKQAIDGKDFSQGVDLNKKEKDINFTIKIVPTTFENGKCGATIILKNSREPRPDK